MRMHVRVRWVNDSRCECASQQSKQYNVRANAELYSAASISIETPQLAPTNLLKCPADVSMFLSPTYQCHPIPQHVHFLAVWHHCPVSSFSSCSWCLPLPQWQPLATSQHQDAEKKKFAVSGSNNLAAVLKDLVNQQFQQFLGLNLTALLTAHLKQGLNTLLSYHRHRSASACCNEYTPATSFVLCELLLTCNHVVD
jgi:hypothetical protein